jgi:AcrR family transcriptional regulator
MPKGTTKRRPETRQRLLDAALEVFAEKGFHGARIEDVCAAAGYTRGAFYSNFKTKDELFFTLFDAHALRVLEVLGRQAEALGERPPTLQDIATAMADIDEHERVWYLVSTEFTLHAIRVPETARVLAEHDARLRRAAVTLLVGLLDRSDIKLRPGVDAEELVRLLIAIREGALAQSYVEPERLPPGTLERRFLPVLLAAVTES